MAIPKFPFWILKVEKERKKKEKGERNWSTYHMNIFYTMTDGIRYYTTEALSDELVNFKILNLG